jgi:hypothetical protein
VSLVNGDFETGSLAGWDVVSEASTPTVVHRDLVVPHGGDYCLEVTFTGEDANTYQECAAVRQGPFCTTPGSLLNVSYSWRTDEVDNSPITGWLIAFYGDDDQLVPDPDEEEIYYAFALHMINGPTSWVTQNKTGIVVPPGTKYFYFYLVGARGWNWGDVGDKVYYDDIALTGDYNDCGAGAGGGITRGRRVPEFTVSFLRRDFTGGVIAPRCTFRPTLMSWTALGGCDLATVVATGNEGALWDLADMLRCPVQIIDQDGQFAWWGYVAAVNIDFGQLSFGVNLDSMANRVAVAYADQGSGVTTSSRATTDWEEDADSVAEYGSFERLESLSDTGSAEAEARRDALLEALKWPVPEIDFGDRGLTGTLTCRGWWHALKRRYYANEGTTDVETTEQIEDIIADVGSEFFTGCVIQDTSGISTNEYRDGDSNAWQIIQDLLESGTAATAVRLLANVDANRTLEVHQEPVPAPVTGGCTPTAR